jgi:hypothetical protein
MQGVEMNANELADFIEISKPNDKTHQAIATMLREQQKRINKLLRWEEHYLAVIESMSLNPDLKTYDKKVQEK